MSNRKINAKTLLEDIRAGLTNDELMDKHSIPSEPALEKLFSKLIDKKLITADELPNRHIDKATFKAKDLSQTYLTPVPSKIKASKSPWRNPEEEEKYQAKKKEQAKQYQIIGGSFGLNGDLIVDGNTFNVLSTQEVSFDRSHIQDIVLSEGKKEKGFSVMTFIIGFILTLIISFFIALLTLGLLTMVAFIIGMVITIVSSFYSKKEKDVGTILLKDGKKLEVTGKLEKLLITN